MAQESPPQIELLVELAKLRARVAEQEQALRATATGQAGLSVPDLCDAVIAVDSDRRLTYVNEVAERQYGVTSSEVLGCDLGTIFDCLWIAPEDEAVSTDALQRAGRWRGTTIHVLRDRRRLLVDVSLSVLRDSQDASIGVVFAIREVSRRNRAHDLLEALIRSAPVGIAFLDPQLRFIDVSSRLAEINGAAASSHIGRHVSEIVPDLVDSIRDVTESIRETGEAVTDLEFAGETAAAPGLTRYWNENWYPVRDVAGEIAGFGVVVEEITERKRAEEALRRSQQQFRAICDGSHEYMGLLTPDGILCEVNRASLEFAGLEREEVLGLPFWETIWFQYTPGASQAVRQAVHRAAAGESSRFESPIITPDGERRTFELSFRPIHDTAGELAFIVPTGVDVTERKEMEESLREADRRKNEFLAMLAHELRNPLAPVRAAVELLRVDAPGDPQVDSARDIIDRQTQQMTRLIDDLLDISRISRGKIILKRGRVDLSTVISGAVETSRPLIEKLEHELTVTLPAEPIVIDADLVRLSQVFMNLLNNAAKYTGPRGRIWVTAERQGSDVAVSVRDSGIGILPDEISGIFEMFSQVEEALSHSQGGLGIGLSLAKRLVEMHGGTIEARSAGRNCGSEFIVKLPIVAQSSEQWGASSAVDDRRLKKSLLRILVVDDNQDAAEGLARLLEIAGNTTRMAYDGEAAVEAAREFRPQVVLLDIGLPKLDGYEAARRIRISPSGDSMFLIAVTGWGHESDVRKALEAGFDRHLVKPVDARSLTALLSSLPVSHRT